MKLGPFKFAVDYDKGERLNYILYLVIIYYNDPASSTQ